MPDDVELPLPWWERREYERFGFPVPVVPSVRAPPPDPDADLTPKQIIEALQRYVNDWTMGGDSCVPIAALAHEAGVSPNHLTMCRRTGNIPKKLAGKLSWLIKAIEAGEFHFRFNGKPGSGFVMCDGPAPMTVPGQRSRIRRDVVLSMPKEKLRDLIYGELPEHFMPKVQITQGPVGAPVDLYRKPSSWR